ncbi:MAG: hypothetical protein KatS3mg090_0172 [Patescibacteria group bacterium]|nr:MAG: hypothetical protein KatS3mg090_0172 [Patescibacteria group bacterium]
MNDLTVVIPVYKNEEKFLEFFNHNFKYFKDIPVVITDDYPLSQLGKKLPKLPNILYTLNKKNLGFSLNVNKGVKLAKTKYVLILNSDVKLVNDKFKEVLKRFKPNIFAFSLKQKEKNNQFVGRNILFFKRGLFVHSAVKSFSNDYNAWADGGAMLVSRRKFLRLGGFSSLYKPFYWEDIDLSYQAWKMGWRIYFVNDFYVEHHHETTIGKYFKKKYVTTIAYRNQLYFCWRNITDLDLLIKHILFLPVNLILIGFKDPLFLIGFFWALLTIFKPLKERIKFSKFKLSDKTVLRVFKDRIK